MKLADIVNQFRRRSSEGTNLIRNPASVVRRHGRRYAERIYRNAEIGGKNKSPDAPGHKKKQRKGNRLNRLLFWRKQKPPEQQPSVQPAQNGQGTSIQNRFAVGQNGGTVARPQDPTRDSSSSTYNSYAATASQDSRFVGSEGAIATLPRIDPTPTIPAPLPAEEILKGTWWGRYTIGECEQDNTRFRRYRGVQNNGNHPVWIYEYQLLETDFNQRDADERRHVFKELIDLNLRLGNDRDFRIVKLQDVVASIDRRCFLIVQAVPEAVPLADWIKSSGAMSVQQVHRVLHQALQSLQYLHSSYRVRWPDNIIERGLYHGNLSLENLWIRSEASPSGVEKPQFFVYLSNFSLWEHLFVPPNEYAHHARVAQGTIELGSTAQDLQQIGKIAFHLLAGGQIDPMTQLPYEPSNPEDWPVALSNHPLKDFLYRLMGLGKQQPFKSAGTALTALHQISSDAVAPLPEALEEEPESDRRVAWYWIALCILAGGLLGFFCFRLLLGRTVSGRPNLVNAACAEPCRLQAMTTLPQGEVSYGLEAEGAWETAFDRAEAWPAVNRIGPNWERTLEQRVADAGSDSLTLDLAIKSSNTAELYEAISQGTADFALMRPDENLPDGLVAEVVAYDGIVAVVPYSDATRQENIAQRLNGKISVETLKGIFTGETTTLAGRAVKTYFPLEPSVNREKKTVRLDDSSPAIAPFKTQLFSELSPEQRIIEESAFEALEKESARSLKQAVQSDLNGSAKALRYDLFARMFRDFERSVFEDAEAVPISIGFEQLSRVYGQCSVYPLAIETGRRAVQPLLQSGDRPLNLKTNLCDDKGGYWPNVEAFKDGSYPLAYPLAVVYAKDSEKGKVISELLKTAEGQYLLSESGLVPTLPIPLIRSMLWSTTTNE